MATAGAYPGRLAEVGLSSVAWTPGTTVSGMTFNDIEKVRSPVLSNAQDSAESSSNDSSGEREFVNTWRSGGFSFEFVADVGGTRQNDLWAYYLAGSQVGFRIRPSGAVSGDFQYFMAGTIESIEPSADADDVGRFKVSVKRTQAVTRTTQ
jgi:hypothetical protein